MRLIFIFAVSLLILCTGAIGSQAQWFSDSTKNTAVCTNSATQDYPKACSDGSEGVVIVWEDTRIGTGYRIYAQRLDNNGKPLWKSNGIPIAPNGAISQRFPVIASDGAGGAYVAWQDYRNSASFGIDVYCQHINADGSLAWDSAGRSLAGGINDQTNPIMTSDGFGNAYVVWEEKNVSSTSQPDLMMNRLTSRGIMWGGFTGTSSTLTNQASKQRRATLCEDGTGGFYAAWDNGADNPISIYAQHVDSTGKLLWNAATSLIYKGTSGSINADSKNVSLRRDGNQLLAVWETTNGSSSADGQDIYANRILSNGSSAPKLYSTAPSVAGSYPGNETNPVIFSDDSVETGQFPYSGFYVIFQSSFQNNHLAMVRMYSDGITQIPKVNGNISSITSTSFGTNGFSAVPNSPGAAIVAWNDSRSDSSIYAQRVDRLTNRYWTTTGSTWGLPVSVRSGTKATQVTLVPRTNGAIAVWMDTRNGNPDIYAQLIFKDGSLPIELSAFDVTSPNIARPEVHIHWQTASEENCAGFELQRREIADGMDNAWTFVANYATTSSLRGAGSSNSNRNYTFIDRDVRHAVYEYRLIDISLDGTKKSHGTRLVEVGSAVETSWSFGPNVPNPVERSTSIPVSLPEAALLDVTIADVSGRIVSHPVMNALYGAGAHSLLLETSELPQTNGVYLASITAIDPTTGLMIWRSPKPLQIAVMR